MQKSNHAKNFIANLECIIQIVSTYAFLLAHCVCTHSEPQENGEKDLIVIEVW